MSNNHEIPTVKELTTNPPRRLVNAWITASVFLVITLAVFVVVLFRHLSIPKRQINQAVRKLRRKFVIIICMLPVYVITAYLSLWFMRAAVVWEFIRSIYEALVLYVFLLILVALMGGPSQALPIIQEKFLRILPLQGSTKLIVAKYGVLQICIVHPLLSLLAIILTLNDAYEEGEFAADNAFPYMVIIKVVSTIIAMVCLFGMYRATKDILQPFKTSLKFLGIKLLLLLNIIQGLILSALVRANKITDDELFSGEIKAEAWQSWLLVLELALLSILIWRAFPPTDYQTYTDMHAEAKTLSLSSQSQPNASLETSQLKDGEEN